MAECVAPSRGFAAAAEKLLNILGYDSDRKDDLSGDVAEFMREYPAADTESARQFRDAADRVNIVFQFAESEISQGELGEIIEFDKGIATSFLFVAADLKKGRYSRSDYARFVREINKRFSAPTVALFRRPESKNKAVLTLAFVGRRQSQTQHGRDVLEKVSLLREIQCENPHRGHLDILAQLSLAERFNWIKGEKKKDRNFDGLLAAWLDELDAEALNRRFYGDLREWFKMARDNAVFPGLSDAANNRAAADSVIRLITRMMFIWFIKEKKLVADQLFSESQISPLLAKYDAAEGDTYYRAILQNLFFATLNTDINARRFSNRNNSDHRNPNLFRYKDLMSDSDAILKLMNQTPFINGGLFDCLDDFEGVLAGGRRVDCFTDNPSQRKELRVPNTLFFSKEKKKFGLLTIFKRYKFTVEENTPVEQEVALDPELLGKVFENLLAEEINPETRNTVRRQTGSFYTPRVVVDYMADESLSAYLAAKVPGNGDRQWRQKLRDLFNYAKTGCENIAKDKIARLVGAVADIKVLDPACGSGAFPMGVLNKLALALSKLDPENKEWKKLQQKRSAGAASEAFYGDYEDNDDARAVRLEEINKTFADYSKPFGRKLFLIQNSIFGTDIQPVACQIAKLRFFISLAIEQEKKGDDKNNYGIRPLPNLETRFVVANTLIGTGGSARQGELGGDEVAKLQKQLAQNRERHFNASVRSVKMQCRREDKRLRDLLAKELKKISGFEPAAKGIAAWNPYDQNAVADWFDSKWMFGIGDGFDVVIGNPPYVMVRTLPKPYKKALQQQKFTAFHGIGDMFMLFYEKGLSLLKDGGTMAFITSNTWMRSGAGANLRRVFARHNPRALINMGAGVFDNATVSTNILLIDKNENRQELVAADLSRGSDFPPSEWTRITPRDVWMIVSKTEANITDKIEKIGTPIKNWNARIILGIKTGYNAAFIIDESVKSNICRENPESAAFLTPIIRGRDVRRYAVNFPGLYLIKIEKGWTDANRGKKHAEDFFRATCPAIYAHLCSFADRESKGRGLRNRLNVGSYWWELRACNYYAEFGKPKLVWSGLAVDGQFAYDEHGVYTESTAYFMVGESVKYLLAVLNSRLSTHQMKSMARNIGDSALAWEKAFVEKLRIPRISKAEQRPFVVLAEKITAAKAANPTADTSKMEAEIDKMVYDLYRLNKDEREIIKSSVP